MACKYSLAGIIMELATRAGMDPRNIDVALLDQEVSGLTVINTYPCVGALQSLAQVFFFDPANYDGKVHFIPRGRPSVATITEAEFLDDEDDVEQEKRADTIQVPRVLHLNYFDVFGGLAPDKQTSERPGERRATSDMSLQSPVMQRADEAAATVTVNHRVMIEQQRGELRFQLPETRIALTPSDPIILQWQGKSARVLIQQVETLDGYQQYIAVRDRQSAYTRNVEGIPPAFPTPPPSSIIGPTLIEVMDIPYLRDADDNTGLGFYVAVSGILPAWTGALIEFSADDGANYIDSQTTRVSAVIGSTMTTLGSHPQEFPDLHNTVRVRIETPNAELLDASLGDMQNRANMALIGDELVNFGLVNEVDEGEWEIGFFLRGRKDTTPVEHPPGTRFVLLERGFLALVPASIVDIGRTLTFRATSFGGTVESGTVVSIIFEGNGQTERHPGYVMARRDGTNAVISWQGVGRLGGGGAVAHGARFAGYRVTVSDGVNPAIVTDTPNQSLTQNVSGLGSPINISVQQLNDFTGAGAATQVVLT